MTTRFRTAALFTPFWGDFQLLLEIRGDRPVPRMAYLEGAVELTVPSQPHEALKSRIGRLVETWCLEKGIELSLSLIPGAPAPAFRSAL